MDKVRIGIIGLGTMGQGHFKTLKEIDSCRVTALFDINKERFSELRNKEELVDNTIACFDSYDELVQSGLCDAVAIVTPHPLHLEMTLKAFEHGLHVMCDKPIAISVADAMKMISAQRDTGLKFSTMYSMRTTPCNRVIREWIQDGRLGNIRRVEMTCTQWLRTQAYYDTQGWRGTWKGEGGGLLMNQAPHNLDLLYWWFGPAKSILAKASNRFHDIETEDEVNAWIVTEAEFIINFYATTGEAPGKDYVEIVGEKGTLIRKDNKLSFMKLSENLEHVIRESAEPFHKVEFEETEVEIRDEKRGHGVVFESFFDAILNNKGNSEMIAPGEDGFYAVEWANAMLQSSIEKREIELPLNMASYEIILDRLREGKLSLT